jgi:hypothetical protein
MDKYEMAARKYLQAQALDDVVGMSEAMREMKEASGDATEAGGGMVGFARAAAQGATLGFWDEIEGRGMSWLPGGGTYEQERDTIRKQQEAWAERNPAVDFGAQVAGGMLTGGLGAGRSALAAGGRMTLKQMANLAKREAALGAASGVGASEAGLDDLGGLARDAAIGGAISGVAAPVMGVGANAWSRRAESPTGRVLRENLAYQDMTPDAAIARMRDLGEDATLATTGPAMRGTMATIAEVPGSGQRQIQEQLLARQMRQPERLQDAVAAATGGAREGPLAATERLGRARSDAAEAAYGPIRDEPITRTREMAAALETDPGRRAARNAIQQLNYARVAQGLPPLEELPDTLQAWDLWKRAMQGHEDSLRRSGDNFSAGSTAEIRRNVVNQLDGQVDGYAVAREGFAAGSRTLEAVGTGEKLLSMPWEQLQRDVARMGPEERQAMTIGAVNAVIERVNKAPFTGNTAWNLSRSPDLRRRLQLLAGDRFDELQARLDAEIQKTLDYNEAMTGSKTARRLASQEANAETGTGEVLYEAATNPTGLVPKALKWVATLGAAKIDEQTRRELTGLLTQVNPDEAERLLHMYLNQGIPLARVEATARALGAAGRYAGREQVSGGGW